MQIIIFIKKKYTKLLLISNKIKCKQSHKIKNNKIKNIKKIRKNKMIKIKNSQQLDLLNTKNTLCNKYNRIFKMIRNNIIQ